MIRLTKTLVVNPALVAAVIQEQPASGMYHAPDGYSWHIYIVPAMCANKEQWLLVERHERRVRATYTTDEVWGEKTIERTHRIYEEPEVFEARVQARVDELAAQIGGKK